MPRTTLHIPPPDPARPAALFAQIANAITDHIRGGRLVFQPGSAFSLAGKRVAAARFGYGACTEAEIKIAVRRLAQCARP